MNLIIAVDTSIPIAACASSVDPPMCGVRITLGSPIRGDSNRPSPFFLGSLGKTSAAPPARWPVRNASAKSSMTTMSPREALIR
jgi:hypothetical protein